MLPQNKSSIGIKKIFEIFSCNKNEIQLANPSTYKKKKEFEKYIYDFY
jgi:hypothetical protein